jgi:hypothetical protein
MKYEALVIFVRHYSAEICRFRYGLTLGISTPNIIASTGVFVCVVCALKRPIRGFSRTQGITLAYLNIRKATNTKRWAQKDIYEERQRTEET